MEKEKTDNNPGDAIPVEFYFPENLVRRYANEVIVQRGENEFTISFFEIIPPIVIGSPDERKKVLDELKSVRATCVASIVVAPRIMPNIIKALQENLNSMIAQLKEQKKQDDQSLPSPGQPK